MLKKWNAFSKNMYRVSERIIKLKINLNILDRRVEA